MIDDELTPEAVAAWTAFADANGVTLADLLTRVVLDVNAPHLVGPKRMAGNGL